LFDEPAHSRPAAGLKWPHGPNHFAPQYRHTAAAASQMGAREGARLMWSALPMAQLTHQGAPRPERLSWTALLGWRSAPAQAWRRDLCPGDYRPAWAGLGFA